jgi:uncharacterized protein YutE (UPF0331/DUF86 family)
MLSKNLILRKIKLMKGDLDKLQPLSKYSFEEIVREEYLHLALERLLEKLINRTIDINTHIIISQDYEPPQDYRDSFLKMSELKILPKKFVEKIIPSVGLRNRLVHEYDDLNANQVYQSIFNALDQFPKYIKFIIKFID